MLSDVLHDWDDSTSKIILPALRRGRGRPRAGAGHRRIRPGRRVPEHGHGPADARPGGRAGTPRRRGPGTSSRSTAISSTASRISSDRWGGGAQSSRMTPPRSVTTNGPSSA
ncbi:hypothetical protein [Actinomadura monticuli]|uniref:hypothetical protein n=1 Tax=Actinomadura monticuli TaxID=3097367 RepID=UPI0035677B4C